LVHASFSSPRQWIDEGLAHFAMALLREQDGRAAAIVYMNQFLPPLQSAEKQPREHGLATSSDELMYRIKAMFVWWMLRDMVGDVPLQRALKQYRPADDKSPSYLPDLIAREAHRDLSWFFDEWVYRDRGLPDFRVVSAFPRQTLANAYVVAVTVENLGAVSAEVPVIVRTAQGDRVKRVLIKAHDKTIERIEVPVMPTEVIVNDGSVPESDTANNSFVIPKEPKP
jgi:aminopeptidase N